MTSRESLVRKAYRKKDVKLTKKAHDTQHFHPDEHPSAGKYLGSAVYGALDGTVTTFAVVSGVVGAELSPSIILILGFANLIADGFSMAASNYLSIKSEQDFYKEEYNREKWEVENYPKGEKEEIRAIYKEKGFTGKDLDRAVEIITSDKELWLKTMMVEELGILEENINPIMAGAVTFVAFLACGLIPLLTFVLIYFFPTLEQNAFLFSCLITAVSIFVVGSLRSLLIAKTWFKAGLEMLLVGGAAAAVAYGIGYLLKGLA
ncbi:MAG: VIT1/CCC1 transporter family protein [Candidatus Altimarinota bacterium]